ncbi:DNA polymerase III subunit chi [Azotobacter vinelandii CA]|uniref:DNA polymerase III chi subunit, HolC n=2 Tax=Azotobacter vinelandii TaxID=354 RepID=C1DPG1_AZOVD|nr:DNA polymerase III subunit chi [Azotobacter vinelandii]ACO77393.1 DNA polymerase III chi subunit, HolC [Azotobacter vinelandii DJ]AGK12500.1 DNA polymerase III subunit chi [Azotobacter vinelandii CA]AGK19773.1 DNA polymerase III subunit chi [Azotobacter vinelandii CA6]WKN23059.1 DNA polymerase III subunit chi [Azotobacter vinelandii]SFX84757.1 DNA polymerase III, chi subunit [Azotobacter vinelandii]
MPQVDFYILPSADPAARLDFACKLTEKAWRLGRRIYLHCQDAPQRETLDARLWSFKSEAFLPHGLFEEDADAPIALGLGDDPGSHRDLLINLALSVPSFCARFERIAELVVSEPVIRQATRASYRLYRERGYALQDHRLSRI